MPKINYVYCDANIFLAYFNAEAGRVEILDQFFEEVQKDSQRKIITSVLSITEVSHVAEEKSHNRLDKKILETMDSLWGDTSLVEFVDVNELIARQARDFMRQAISLKVALRSNDAIHLASAKYVTVSEFFTYALKLQKYNSMTGYDIKEPYINSPRLPLIFDEPPKDG